MSPEAPPRLTSRPPGRVHHACRAEGAGRSDAGLPDGAPTTEHQHPLGGGQTRPPRQRHPGCNAREPERGDQVVSDRRLEGYDVAVRHQAQLGQAAVTGPHPGRGEEPDPGADRVGARGLHHTDALATRHVRRCRHTEVRRARGAEQVQRHDRRRGHPDQRRAGRGPRRGVLAVRRRRPGGVQDGCAHHGRLTWRCRGRAARGAPSPCRRRSGTPAARGRARTWR